MLVIEDIKSIQIYKIKDWCIYFRYNGEHYMIRHLDECGDHWNELTNKDTWERKTSGHTLFDIKDFLRTKYYTGYKRNIPYSHIDKEYFVAQLVKLGMVEYKFEAINFNKIMKQEEGDTLKEFIKVLASCAYTEEEIAAMTGMKQPAINRLKKGKIKNPKIETLLTVLEPLGYTLKVVKKDK